MKVANASPRKTLSPVVSIPQPHLAVVVNPFTGNGRGVTAWQDFCLPVFKRSPVTFETFVTEGNDYAYDFGRTFNHLLYDGIVSVGGDGLLNEIINGIMDREDWQKVIAKITFSVVPAGTGNALCSSLGIVDYERAAALIAAGKETRLDLFSVRFANGRRRFGFVSFNFCFFGDFEKHADKYRWISGYTRYYVGFATYLFNIRKYAVRCAFLTAEPSAGGVKEKPFFDPALPKNPRFGPAARYTQADFAGGAIEVSAPRAVMFCASSLPDLDTETHMFPARHDDGLLHTVIGDNLGAWELTRFFLSLPREDYAGDPKIRYFKSKALFLESDERSGFFNIDGEHFEYCRSAIIEMHPGLLRLRGINAP